MKDILFIRIDCGPDEPDTIEGLDKTLDRIDSRLKEHGWENAGVFTITYPDPCADKTYFQVIKAVKGAEWTNRGTSEIPDVGSSALVNACRLDEIIIRGMGPVSEKKIKKYRDYFEQQKQYAHAIIVDEDHVLRDGFTTYMLAMSSGVTPDIIMAGRDQEIRKIVYGRHVKRSLGGFAENNPKTYAWRYQLKEAVAPGDILRVKTQKGKKLMCVDRIGYAVGKQEYKAYKPVVEHLCEQMIKPQVQ